MMRFLKCREELRPGRKVNAVKISKYSRAWAEDFSREAKLIESSVKCAKIYVDHVGSTSVRGLSSKPIIDILISLGDWAAVEGLVTELEGIGYSVSEVCKEVPRYFLTKNTHGELEGYHIHVCEPARSWGRDMLVFRNELASDDGLARAYGKLKEKLAEEHDGNVGTYMIGKKPFIEERLREVDGEFSVNRLLSQQRAESSKAETLQIWMMSSQLGIAVVAAVSVYLSSNSYLFILAFLGFGLMLGWLYLSQEQQKHRSAGDQARRAVLLISGLDMKPSAGQKLRINEGFHAVTSGKTLRREEDHFATREVPSYKRLAEMIEESSYWTRALQRLSAKVMIGVLFFLAAVVFVAGGAAIASLDSDALISTSRAMIAIMIFVISSDALGLFLSYKNSASTIDEVFTRVEGAAARNYSESDVLLLMSDYNAAIERAPATLPGVYKFSQKKLNRRWQAYIGAKLTG